MLLVYRMKKKDKGSYTLEEPKQATVTYQKPDKQEEFYALYVNISVSFLASLTICMTMKSFYPSHHVIPLDELCSCHTHTYARTHTPNTQQLK